MASLLTSDAAVRVSTVLNRDTKQFGKKFMFDDQEDTCWNSDHGTPQWVQVSFASPVNIEELHIKFQGGFVGQECFAESPTEQGDGAIRLGEFYPEDINSLQIFKMNTVQAVRTVKITFGSSTDFFGRITIYKLDILGNKT